jgi:hypothetical protein
MTGRRLIRSAWPRGSVSGSYLAGTLTLISTNMNIIVSDALTGIGEDGPMEA